MKINLESFYTLKELTEHYRMTEKSVRHYLKERGVKPISVRNGKHLYTGYAIALNDGTLQHLLSKKERMNQDETKPTYDRFHYYKLKEVAEMLGISKQGVLKLIESGKLKALKMVCRDKYIVHGWEIANFSYVASVELPKV